MLAQGAEEAVLLVRLDHHDVDAFTAQPFDDGQAHRPEPDHDHVVAQARDLAPAERLLQRPADEDVRQQREEAGQHRRPDDHQRDRPDPQPGPLVAEVEVPEAHRADRLDREVEGVEHRHPPPVGLDVADRQHDDRRHDEAEQQDEHELDPPVEGGEQVAEQRLRSLARFPVGPGADEGRTRRLVRGRGETRLLDGRHRAHQRDGVAGVDGVVTSGRHLDVRGPARDDAQGSQVAVQLTQGAVGRAHALHDHEGLAAQLERVRAREQAGLDHGGCGQAGDVEDGDPDRGEGAPDARVPEGHDDADVGPQLPHEQRGGEGVQVVALGADQRDGSRETGVDQHRRCPRVAAGRTRRRGR